MRRNGSTHTFFFLRCALDMRTRKNVCIEPVRRMHCALETEFLLRNGSMRQVRLKIKHMEIEIRKRESTGDARIAYFTLLYFTLV